MKFLTSLSVALALVVWAGSVSIPAADAHEYEFRQEGYQRGYADGFREGYRRGYHDAYERRPYHNHAPTGRDAYSEGVHEGRHTGYVQGYNDARRGIQPQY